MQRLKKRTVCLLLAAVMLLGMLAGCGKKDDTQQLSATVYVPKYIDLNLDLDYISGGCSDGENLYLIGERTEEIKMEAPEGMSSDEAEKYGYTTYRNVFDIYRVALDGSGTVEKLPNYQAPKVPDGKDGNCSVSDIAIAEDGSLWVTEMLYIWGNTSMNYPAVDEPAIIGSSDVMVQPVARSASDTASAEAEAEDESSSDEDAGDVDVPADEPAEEESSETVLRRKLDKDGNELECIDMSKLQEKMQSVIGEDEYLNMQAFDTAGNLYVGTETKIYALDDQMEVRFELDGEDMWYNLIPLAGGLMGMQKRDYDEATETSSNKLLTIDPEKQAWGKEYVMPNNAYNIYPGGGDYLFYYQVNDAVFGFKADESKEGGGAGERLFSWVEADISSDSVRNFFFLPDGRVAAILQEYDNEYENITISVALLAPTPRSELPEKTTLVYASLYLSYDARKAIIDFNKKSETHRIEVKDYAEFDIDGSSKSSLQKLNTEILAGNVPDILDTSNLPLRQYGSKGILEDLWPFIDKDPDLGRDKLMVRPLEANQQDGKLYEIFGNFTIRTVAGPTKIVGDRMSWTLADLREALAKMPEGCSIFGEFDTKSNMLDTVVSLNMDQFVDWETGKCNFDSDQFKAMLEFCNTFPAEFNSESYDWDEWEGEEARILSGKQMLSQSYLSNFDWTVQSLNALHNGEYSYVGYPREDGGCGSSFSFYNGIAMTSSCKDKDGAWSFIRQVLLPQEEESGRGRYYYSARNFSVNKADFDKAVEMALTPQYQTDGDGNNILDDDGNPIPVSYGSIWVDDNTEIEMKAPTQSDVDKVIALYEQVDSIYRRDDKIMESVLEVASQYFAGDKPLNDAASLIQNKVTLYVNENR